MANTEVPKSCFLCKKPFLAKENLVMISCQGEEPWITHSECWRQFLTPKRR